MSGCLRSSGSQKEKGEQEALLLCFPSGLPPGSHSFGAPQGLVTPAPASSWGTVLTAGTRLTRVCASRGIVYAEGFPISRREEQEEGSPDQLSFGSLLLSQVPLRGLPSRGARRNGRKKTVWSLLFFCYLSCKERVEG